MFYYTNFIVQTNVWWLRRVRPVWMGATFLIGLYYLNKYYFFGKQATKQRLALSPEQLQRRVDANKGTFGYGTRYQPTYYRSRKKFIMQAMGDFYDHAVETQDRWIVPRNQKDVIDQIQEENNY